VAFYSRYIYYEYLLYIYTAPCSVCPYILLLLLLLLLIAILSLDILLYRMTKLNYAFVVGCNIYVSCVVLFRLQDLRVVPVLFIYNLLQHYFYGVKYAVLYPVITLYIPITLSHAIHNMLIYGISLSARTGRKKKKKFTEMFAPHHHLHR